MAQSKQIDVVYLNNGSILKGTITEMIVNESLTVKMDNGSIMKVKMANVKKIVKETLKEVENTETIRKNNINETEIVSKPKKKKGKFWKALGNIVVTTLNKTAEDVKNRQNSETNNKTSEIEESEEFLEEDEETVNELNNDVGSICFVNPNYYSRKIILTNRTNGKQQTIIVGKANYGKTVNSCAYDISSGIYDCKVYTTFSRKMIEQYNIRINSNEETSKNLTKNHYN